MRRTLMVAALAAFPAAGWDQARADAELSLYEAELREAGATSARADAKDAEVAPVELRGDEEGFLVLAKEREGLLEVLRGESKEGEDVARFDSLGLPALRSAVLGGSSAPAGVDAEVWARVASAHRVSQYRASVASSQRADSVSQSLRSGKAPGAKAERRADGEDELKPLPLSNLARGGDTSREITR